MWLFSKGGSTDRPTLDLATVSINVYDKVFSYNQFDCGRTPLNNFIKNKAKKSLARLEHRTFVALGDGSKRCLGYYALQVGSDQLPQGNKHSSTYVGGYAAFPAIHLSFLAVDRDFQRQGLGRYLLQDVFTRVAQVAKHVGFFALTLQSLDNDSTEFYRSIGFEEYTEGGHQPKMLYPISDILKLIEVST
jgi:GNAT superfamily N-acetyltransferase